MWGNYYVLSCTAGGTRGTSSCQSRQWLTLDNQPAPYPGCVQDLQVDTNIRCIERESNKKILCGMFIHSNLLAILYDILPGFDTTQDLDIEVLEGLWEVLTEEQWHTLRQETSGCQDHSNCAGRHALGGDGDDPAHEPYYISGFTALIVIHAVKRPCLTSQPGLPNPQQRSQNPKNTILPTSCYHKTLTSLARCHNVPVSAGDC